MNRLSASLVAMTLVLLAGCSSPQPALESDPIWQAIQDRGSLIVGVAANYPPFEFYNSDLQFDGFDIALARAMAANLGLAIEFHDYSFEGLINAVSLNQVDIAISALSVNAERLALVDFSRVYFVGEDAVVALAGGQAQIGSVADLLMHRVGVERGSVYERLLTRNLASVGLPTDGVLYSYISVEDAINDLRADRVDFVLMDHLPAEEFLKGGGLELAATELNTQFFSVAVPKGAQVLRSNIDLSITRIAESGLLSQLGQLYLGLENITLPPVSNPEIQPTEQALECVDDMAFVEALTLEDTHFENLPQLSPGVSITKSWRIENTGTCTWTTSAYQIVYESGITPEAQMGGEPVPISENVAPGERVDIHANLITPLKPGDHIGFWNLTNSSGNAFGERLWVAIHVVDLASPTPGPTPTHSTNVDFRIDRTSIKEGECIRLSWTVLQANAVYLHEDGEPWENQGVPLKGEKEDCLLSTRTFVLRVWTTDNFVQNHEITVNVEQNTTKPDIRRFTVEPSGQITLGQCLNLAWAVKGQVSNVGLELNSASLWGNAPTEGTYHHCPAQTGNLAYRLSATGPGGTTRSNIEIRVVSPVTATPVPTVVPEKPVIQSFSVSPAQIEVGACLTISWKAGGGSQRIQIIRNSDVLLDNASFSGSEQDCPQNAGNYTYSILARNLAGESASKETEVIVSQAPPQNQLAGTNWTIIEAVGEPVTGANLSFSDNGKLSGFTGCNTLSATYTAANGILSIANLAIDHIPCRPPSLSAQEKAILDGLNRAVSFSRNGDTLVIMNANRQEMFFLELAPGPR